MVKCPKCPKCKEELIRVRRKPRDRLISYLIPLRRYQCVKHTCRWHGVRVCWADFGKWRQQKSAKKRSKSS